MMELISHKSKINFLGLSKFCIVISTALIAFAFYVFISQGEGKYGTDFSGGHELLVSFSSSQDSESIRKGLASQGLSETRVQAFKVNLMSSL